MVTKLQSLTSNSGGTGGGGGGGGGAAGALEAPLATPTVMGERVVATSTLAGYLSYLCFTHAGGGMLLGGGGDEGAGVRRGAEEREGRGWLVGM